MIRALQAIFCRARINGKQSQNLLLNCRVVTEAINPLDARLAPEPGQLPLCVMAHVELRLFDRTLKRALAFEVLNNPAIAMSSERAGIWRHALLEQLFDFID